MSFKFFFPQKFIFRTFSNFALVGATIIDKLQTAFFDMSLGSYRISALAANRKIEKLKVFWASLFAGLAVQN
ncbi:MAG: hypothetical protein A2719_05180 [Candidatus Ryanbacteria bacterium RIFCSPHIGHO2_01_FULL_45_22]|uniref:Uncharacterized protein n=1 Tax=Candidatus Ryanbacteria bacterium RIFCSPHIGHO2_01_FULL_45_22 TaxID=1802114 RepID=A0A1G2G2Y2_9BACT|nr:MAG: hypothetical protein A2719_05180 [Candidatus Ryanbacteria bacterium RIFCSPHIGHO2_01_FULL_45_22]